MILHLILLLSLCTFGSCDLHSDAAHETGTLTFLQLYMFAYTKIHSYYLILLFISPLLPKALSTKSVKHIFTI